MRIILSGLRMRSMVGVDFGGEDLGVKVWVAFGRIGYDWIVLTIF